MEIVIATQNNHKIAELRATIPSKIAVLLPVPAPVSWTESGLTFADNARIKAELVRKTFGKPALADDSGLVVPALGGEPGVRSARYAGENATDAENLALLQTRIAPLPPGKRDAYFVCVLLLLDDQGTETIFEGRMDGRLIDTPRGTFGFGYDPIFVPTGHSQTFAEMPPEEKNAISHRGKAVGSLLQFLVRRFPPLAIFLAGIDVAKIGIAQSLQDFFAM